MPAIKFVPTSGSSRSSCRVKCDERVLRPFVVFIHDESADFVLTKRKVAGHFADTRAGRNAASKEGRQGNGLILAEAAECGLLPGVVPDVAADNVG